MAYVPVVFIMQEREYPDPHEKSFVLASPSSIRRREPPFMMLPDFTMLSKDREISR